MNDRVDIVLTNWQIEAIEAIRATTRYEAMDKVAEILGAKLGQHRTWGCTTRKTIIIDKTTTADITFSKGRVKDLQYYSTDDVFYNRFTF